MPVYKASTCCRFVDNHDVTRIASDSDRIKNMPEARSMVCCSVCPVCRRSTTAASGAWRATSSNGDPTLRPAVEKPDRERPDRLGSAALAHARTGSKALCWGSYRNVLVQPKQLIFERYADGERVLVAINADGNPFTRPL